MNKIICPTCRERFYLSKNKIFIDEAINILIQIYTKHIKSSPNCMNNSKINFLEMEKK